MKQIIAVLLIVFGLMFATNVVAETYVVKPGDTLGKIAKSYQGVSWHDIYQANLRIIKNPDRIYIGQVLEIPVVKKKGRYQRQAGDMVAFTERPVYHYTSPGSNPVGKNTNPVEYIQKGNFPKKLEAQFIYWATHANNDYHNALIVKEAIKLDADKKRFSHFDTMGYGHGGNVVYNVEVGFDDPRDAIFWQIDSDGIRYYLICDLRCYNWSTFREEIVGIEDTDTVAIGHSQVQDKGNVSPVVATKKSSQHIVDPDVEAWLYGGVSKGVDHNVGDTGKYYGVSVSAWLDKWQVGNGYFRIGPSYQYVGWDGTADNVDYDGHFSLFGAEAQYLTSNSKDQLKILSGKKDGYVYGNGFPYYAHETADITALEGAHQWWNPAKNYQAEIGFRAEIAYNNDKSSTWENHIISREDDPALNQSMYSVRGKYTYTKYRNFMPTLEGSGSYRQSNHSKAIQIRPGLKLWDETIEPSVHYERGFVDGEQTGTIGANVNIDLSKLGKKILTWLRGSNSQSGKTETKSKSVKPVKSTKQIVAVTVAGVDYYDDGD